MTFEYIEEAQNPETCGLTGDEGYENAARFACKTILAVARRDPMAFRQALDEYRENPYTSAVEDLLTPEERELVVNGRWGVTGFQWGWAMQTAAWLLEQAPVSNGALLMVEIDRVTD